MDADDDYWQRKRREAKHRPPRVKKTRVVPSVPTQQPIDLSQPLSKARRIDGESRFEAVRGDSKPAWETALKSEEISILQQQRRKQLMLARSKTLAAMRLSTGRVDAKPLTSACLVKDATRHATAVMESTLTPRQIGKQMPVPSPLTAAAKQALTAQADQHSLQQNIEFARGGFSNPHEDRKVCARKAGTWKNCADHNTTTTTTTRYMSRQRSIYEEAGLSSKDSGTYQRKAKPMEGRVPMWDEHRQCGFVLAESAFSKRWDMYTTLLLLYTAVFTPFQVTFLVAPSTKTFDSLSGDLVVFIMDQCVNFSFLLDTLLCFISPYATSNGMLVRNQWLIARRWACMHAHTHACVHACAPRYIQSWFLLDIVSIIPFGVPPLCAAQCW